MSSSILRENLEILIQIGSRKVNHCCSLGDVNYSDQKSFLEDPRVSLTLTRTLETTFFLYLIRDLDPPLTSVAGVRRWQLCVGMGGVGCQAGHWGGQGGEWCCGRKEQDRRQAGQVEWASLWNEGYQMWFKLPWNRIRVGTDHLFKDWSMLCLFQHSIQQLFEMDQSKHWLPSFIGIEESLSRNPLVISVALPEKEAVLLNCFINYINEQVADN